MYTTTTSPTPYASRARAPEPSAALIALQEKGFELPRYLTDSISPHFGPAVDDRTRVSPLSIVATPSNLGCSTSVDVSKPGGGRRPSSTGSAETTITNILKLYVNSSKQSLGSAYEEMAVNNDDSDEDVPPLPAFHQPKAYRDTIAPLLEHQFSGDNLTVPAAPSPMSIASMPMLMHPNASISVPSLTLTPEVSPNLQPTTSDLAGLSQSSIQITPDMSPPLQALAPSFHDYTQGLTERKIALQVPDVREAESWYDQPLSPISPEDSDTHLRDSNMSAVSPNTNIGYQRALTLDALVPSKPQSSPNMRPVSVVRDHYLPSPVGATSTEVVDNKMMPPPLDLSRSQSISRISEGSAPIRTPELHTQEASAKDGPKSQHASLVEDTQAPHMPYTDDPIEGPMRTYLTPLPTDRLSKASSQQHGKSPAELDEIYRPASAFSDASSDSFVIHDTLSGQLKHAWREKFGRKKEKKEKDKSDNKNKNKTKSGLTAPISIPAHDVGDDVDSYKYPYWKSHSSIPANNTIPPPHTLHSPEMRSIQDQPKRASAQSGPGPSISSSPQPPSLPNLHEHNSSNVQRPQLKRRQPQPAIPLTKYQKYGVEIWYESNKKKRSKEREAARKAAEKQQRQADKDAVRHGTGTPDQDLQHARPSLGQRTNMTRSFAGSETGSVGGGSSERLVSNTFYHNKPSHSYHASESETVTSQGSAETTFASVFSGASAGVGAGSGSSSRPGSSVAGYDNIWKPAGTSVGTGPGPGVYDNALFEASGGEKKRTGFASRLMMSSEQKRKQKVKESIVVVGGASVKSGSERGLVKI